MNASNHKYFKICLILALLILIGGAWYCCREAFDIKGLRQVVNDFGIWSSLGFIFIYTIAVVLMLPGSVFTLLGGLIFGPILGTLYNIVAATLGATVAFLLARYIAQDWFTQKLGGRLQNLKQSAEQAEWGFVAVVRLTPIIPFNIANYALGLTKISIFTYVLGSMIFMLPACFVYTYIGSLGVELAYGDIGNVAVKFLWAVGGIVVLICIPWIVRRLKKPDC